MPCLEYELTNNNNYYSCGDKRNDTINMRQQVVIHQEPHPSGTSPNNIPSSSNGRTSSDNTHLRIHSQNGNNRLDYDCTDEAAVQHHSSSVITSSSFYPTKTQIIAGSAPTLERVTQFHTSHIPQQNNNSFSSKGLKISLPFLYFLL